MLAVAVIVSWSNGTNLFAKSLRLSKQIQFSHCRSLFNDDFVYKTKRQSQKCLPFKMTEGSIIFSQHLLTVHAHKCRPDFGNA